MSNAGSDWSAAFAAASADSMRVYDRVLARLFTPWAHDLITRLAPAAGSSALDVACGPGTVARLLARAVGPTGHVRATDISPAMLEIAQTKPLDEGSAPIEWIASPAAPLPVPDESADVITCQQGLQFFPDPVASLDEMRRALRDGGVAGVSIWTSVSEQIFHVLHDAAETVLGPELAARYRGPFLMAGDQAAEAARAAGFADVTIVTHTMPAVIDEGFDAMFDTLVASGIATDVAALDQDAFGSFRDEAARIAQRYADGSTLRGSMTASIMLAS